LLKSQISQFAFHQAKTICLTFACLNVLNDFVKIPGLSRDEVMRAGENHFALTLLRISVCFIERVAHFKTSVQSSKINQFRDTPRLAISPSRVW
jgi:hypothetical protein